MSTKAKKAIIWSVASLLFVFIVLCGAVGMYMTSYALTPDNEHFIQKANDYLLREYPGVREWADSLESAGVLKMTTRKSRGRSLSAYYAAADSSSKKTAIIVHGYTSCPEGMFMIARMFRDSLGYNVFVPYLQYHGHSEGPAIQMGWKDRIDVEEWIPIAHEMFNDTLQVVQGISMGGATTMMVSGDNLPDYVKGFIEDCGYSSVWDQFAMQLKDQFGLPTFPVLNAANVVCRLKYGWGFREASSVKQLAKCYKPMLFIHGDNDDYVPSAMIYDNYEAKTHGYREMWITPGCAHANSYRDWPAEYTQHVRTFLKGNVE